MYCILHGATNETTNGAQNKNVNNIVIVLLYNNIIFYLLLKYSHGIL